MKRFIQGEDRTQATLLTELLDDYISENNPVRVIDVYVDNLDLGKLGFEAAEPSSKFDKLSFEVFEANKALGTMWKAQMAARK